MWLIHLWILAFLSCVVWTEADWTKCIPECECKWKSGKKTAKCKGVGFTKVPEGISDQIQHLDLSNNNITSLPKHIFRDKKLVNVHKLFLTNNGLVKVDKDAFSMLSILIQLDLSNNRIRELQPGTFKGCERLRLLSLNNNQLTKLKDSTFPALGHLANLDLSYCQLSHIHFRALSSLKGLEILNLRGNKFVTLNQDPLKSLVKLNSLILVENPWKCDCHLRGFKNWLQKKKLHSASTACEEPELLAGKTWDEIDKEDFACKPEIWVPTQEVVGEEGENVTISCHITGDPVAETKWVFNTRVITNMSTIPFANQTFIIREGGTIRKWSNLTITYASRQDVGDYTCVGVNSRGVQEQNVSVVLEREPLIHEQHTVDEPPSFTVIIIIASGCALFVIFLTALIAFCWRKRLQSNRNRKPGKLNGSVYPSEQANSLLFPNPVPKPARVTSNYEELNQSEMEMVKPKEASGPPSYENYEDFNYGNTIPVNEPMSSAAAARESRDADDVSKRTAGSTQTPETVSVKSDVPLIPGENYPDLLNIPNRDQQKSPTDSSSSVDPYRSNPQVNTTFLNPGEYQPVARYPHYAVRPSYVTLPRRPRTPSWGSNNRAAILKVDPVYDTLGPRTTADGSSKSALNVIGQPAGFGQGEPISPLSPSSIHSTSSLPPYYAPVGIPEPYEGYPNHPPRSFHLGTLPRSTPNILDSVREGDAEQELEYEEEKDRKVSAPAQFKYNKLDPVIDDSDLSRDTVSTDLNTDKCSEKSSAKMGDAPQDITSGALAEPQVPAKGPSATLQEGLGSSVQEPETEVQPKKKKVPPKVPPKPRKKPSAISLSGASDRSSVCDSVYEDEGEDGTEI